MEMTFNTSGHYIWGHFYIWKNENVFLTLSLEISFGFILLSSEISASTPIQQWGIEFVVGAKGFDKLHLNCKQQQNNFMSTVFI